MCGMCDAAYSADTRAGAGRRAVQRSAPWRGSWHAVIDENGAAAATVRRSRPSCDVRRRWCIRTRLQSMSLARPMTLEKIRVYVIISTRDGRTAQIQPSNDCLHRTFRRSKVISRNRLLWLRSSVRPADKTSTTDCVGRVILTGNRSGIEIHRWLVPDRELLSNSSLFAGTPVAHLPRHAG
jgi:hypothetical protein